MTTAAIVVIAAVPSVADITVGPWTFDDRAFADDAVQLDEGEPQLLCDALDVRDALVGYSPRRQIVNTGYPGTGNDFALFFEDLLATNSDGPDLVFFEARFSADPYEIAVRPVGGDWTDFLPYAAEDFLPSDERHCAWVHGLEIELDDHGIAAGVQVDGLRFRALPRPPAGNMEGDPVMAAVLGGCIDTDATSAPGEPGDLRIDGDRRTLRFVPDDDIPGESFNAYRGELADLRATATYELTCVAHGLGVPFTLDPAAPGPGRPLYYLVTAVNCFGESGLGRRSDRVLRELAGPACP